MKKYVYPLLVIFLLVACTDYKEVLEKPIVLVTEAGPLDLETTLPIINLVVNQEEFDNMYLNFNENIEIEGDLNLYRNKELVLKDKLVEIEIKGSYSASFGLKSLGIKFDKTYNNTDRKLLNPKKILPQHSLDKIKAFRLRNSGNDFEQTMIKDISYTQLAINAGLNIDITYSEQALVFVNNSFLGIMNLRSEGNTNGMSRLNDTKKKHITLAKINDPGEVEKKDGDFDRIDNFLEAITAEDLNYLKEAIDIANFIDYVIFQTYVANVDWPYNNVRFYAVKEGPFRFVMYDLDWVNIRKTDEEPLDFIKFPSKHGVDDAIDNPITDLFNILYADATFRNRFETRYLEVVNSGSLSAENFRAITIAHANAIEEFMPLQIEKYKQVATMVEWYRYVDLLKANNLQREKNLNTMNMLF